MINYGFSVSSLRGWANNLGLQFTGLEGRHMGFMRFWPFDSLLFGSILVWSSFRVVVHLQWSQIISCCVLLWFFLLEFNSKDLGVISFGRRNPPLE